MIDCAADVLKSVYKSYPSNLDRWTISIKQPNNTVSYTMCNYIGLGVDAKIAYDFHKLRETKPYLFKSRVFSI